MYWIAIAAAAVSGPNADAASLSPPPLVADEPQDAVLEWIDSLLDLYYDLCDILGPYFCKYAQTSVDSHLLTFASGYDVYGTPTLSQAESDQARALLADFHAHLDAPLAGSAFAVNSARDAAASMYADLGGDPNDL